MMFLIIPTCGQEVGRGAIEQQGKQNRELIIVAPTFCVWQQSKRTLYQISKYVFKIWNLAIPKKLVTACSYTLFMHHKAFIRLKAVRFFCKLPKVTEPWTKFDTGKVMWYIPANKIIAAIGVIDAHVFDFNSCTTTLSLKGKGK